MTATGVPPVMLQAGFLLNTPFQRRILSLADRGVVIPCLGSPLHTADDRATRVLAEPICVGCPVFAACDKDAADRGEQFGVWASVDRTPGCGRRAVA